MLQKYKGRIWLTILVSLLFLLASCGTASAPSPSQTLQNSIKAMSQLKFVHFDLQNTLKFQTTDNTNASEASFNITGQGDAVAPDQVSVSLLQSQKPLVSVVRTGGKVYVREGNGKWYVTDQNKVPDNVQKFFSQNVGNIINAVEKAKLTDHGQEVLNGEKLDHITAALDPQTLQALSSQINGLLPKEQQSSQNMLKQATVDFWIDQSTEYIHQAQLNATASVDLSKMLQISVDGQKFSIPANVQLASLKSQVNFSKFNQPVTIQAPSGAVPLQQH
jgi:hypothetical protein